MKRLTIASISAIALLATVPFVSAIPGVPSWNTVGNAIAETLNPAKVDLTLSAEKQEVKKDEQGQDKIVWKNLQGNVVVQPGDVLRYTLVGQNTGAHAVRNLTLNQPIPKGTAYVLNTATASLELAPKITYSIDGGKTYSEKPTIEVKQPDGTVKTEEAPAEAYTNIRWKFGASINPASKLSANYQVKVR